MAWRQARHAFQGLLRAHGGKGLQIDARERVCCLLVLDSVTSTPQCIRQPKPRRRAQLSCLCSSLHHPPKGSRTERRGASDDQPWEGALVRLCEGCPYEAPCHLRAQVTDRGESQNYLNLPNCEHQTLRTQGTAKKELQQLDDLRPAPRPQVKPMRE